MWEIIKKFLALIMTFKEHFTQQKQKEVEKIQQEEAKAHAEVQKEYEEVKQKLEDDGWSGDSFESALDELRRKQSS